MRGTRSLPLTAITVSVVLWSTAYVASGLVLEDASPAVLSVGRHVIALAVLLPFAVRRRGFLRLLADRRSVVLGATGVLGYYAFMNIGLEFTTPGTAALVSASLPALTALAALVLLRERVQVRTIVGLVLVTVGVAAVAAAGLEFDTGVLLNLAGLASYGAYTALLRRWSTRLTADPLVLGTAPTVWGTALMLPWLGWEGMTGTARVPTDGRTLGILVLLGLVVTASTLVLFAYGAARVPATLSGVLTAGVPVLGYALAVTLGEPIAPWRVAGGLLALAGVLVATVPVRARTDPSGGVRPDGPLSAPVDGSPADDRPPVAVSGAS